MGHWTPGSTEPERYDSRSGVTELDTRHYIMGAFRDGWAPAQEGELSTPYLPLGIPPRRVEVPLRRKRKRLALSARPKLGSKADQQHRGTSSRRPLSSATHVPQPVDFEGGIASTPTPSSSLWGGPTPRLR